MNPEETNSNANMGASAAPGMGASGSTSVDFTAMGDSSNGLSMADSMASAEDNLTSAGMAAKEGDSGAIGLDQIGASDPSATMARPDEPLIPAAPVPGSLGSAISGPALAPVPDAGSPLMNPAAAATPAAMDVSGAQMSQVPQMPTVEQPMETQVQTMDMQPQPVMPQPAAAPQEAPQPAVMSQPEVQQPAVSQPAVSAAPVAPEPYNPFMPTSTPSASTGMDAVPGNNSMNTPMASSSNIPAALQPKTERFSDKGHRGSSMTMILGILAALMTIIAVVFLVLWLITTKELEEARDSQEIIYLPTPTDPDDQTPVEVKMSCWQDPSSGGMEGVENMTHLKKNVSMNFSDDVLQNISIVEDYTFTDHDAAENARGVFDAAVASYTDFAIGSGITTLGMTYMVNDNIGTWNAYGNADQLVWNNVWAFGLPMKEDGNAVLEKNEIVSNYEGQGFVCEEVDK